MSQIEILPVRNKREQHTFLTFPWQIYKNDPLWVPPVLPERRKTIDPRQGAFFKRGEAEFFIAWEKGKPLGTICAADDRIGNQLTGKKDCLWGFFECIQDYDVAAALWQHVIDWGRKRGLNALYGPFNLDYEDGYGILVEGRDRPPVMLCGHTPVYYLDYVERFGFKPGRGQNLAFEVRTEIDTAAFQQLARMAEIARRKEKFVIRSANFKRWEDEIDPLLVLLNASLAHLEGHIPWQRDDLRALLAPFREFADPELVLFAELNGRMIGFFPGIPNLNEALIHANGLRYPWDYLSAWFHMRRKPDCLSIKSVLVHPDFWGGGASILLFDEMLKRLRAKGFRWVDLSLTSDDNPKTPMLAERLGGKIYKRYQVYRYPFVA